MKIMLETTDWGANSYVRNNVYVMNDAMTKIIAYVPAGSKTVKKFKAPLAFDTRGRSFEELEGEADTPDPQVITVEGSKGQKYFLSNEGEGWRCTCTGFRFHGRCRHITEFESKQEIQ